MLNKELLDTIKEQGKGLIFTKRDYKFISEEDKKELESRNSVYEYSKFYSVVFDGVNSVKITYSNFPKEADDKDHDPLKDYTNFKYLTITLKDIENLKFID